MFAYGHVSKQGYLYFTDQSTHYVMLVQLPLHGMHSSNKSQVGQAMSAPVLAHIASYHQS